MPYWKIVRQDEVECFPHSDVTVSSSLGPRYTPPNGSASFICWKTDNDGFEQFDVTSPTTPLTSASWSLTSDIISIGTPSRSMLLGLVLAVTLSLLVLPVSFGLRFSFDLLWRAHSGPVCPPVEPVRAMLDCTIEYPFADCDCPLDFKRNLANENFASNLRRLLLEEAASTLLPTVPPLQLPPLSDGQLWTVWKPSASPGDRRTRTAAWPPVAVTVSPSGHPNVTRSAGERLTGPGGLLRELQQKYERRMARNRRWNKQ